jgi:hypothetical protein
MSVNIDKIRSNLQNLIDLNDQSYPSACNQISIVQGYLNGTQPKDNGPGLFSNLLFSAVGLIGEIDGIPGAPVVAWFISAVVNQFNQQTHPDLYNEFPGIEARYDATYRAIDTELINILNDIPHKLETILTIPDGLNLPPPFNTKKSIAVKELSNYDIPHQKTDDFDILKNRFINGFRNGLFKQQLPRYSNFGIGCIFIKRAHFYYTYIMTAPGSENDTKYWWNSDDGFIIDNKETQLDRVSISGNSVQDFKSKAAEFNEKVGGSLVVPVSVSNSEIIYHKYYLFTGYETNEHSGWNLASNDFYEMLFQDDGFGNIVRPDSVGTRDTIFRTWGIVNGSSIPAAVDINFSKKAAWFNNCTLM